MHSTSKYLGLLSSGASVLALCIAGASPALAQTTAEAGQPAPQAQSTAQERATAQGPAENSRDVVVIVGQTIEETLPQELAKYGSDVEVTDSQEMRDSLFVDVSQALQMDTPGLFLAPRGGPFSYMDISLQGSRTQDMLFLVDGVRINNRLYSSTMTDTLPGSMTERVEVLKGGQSLFYGTQAAAGVINIVTRGYTDDFNGQLTVSGDTNDSIHYDGYARGKAGPGNYVVYASQDKSNGIATYTTIQPSATDQRRSYDLSNVGVKYRLDLLDNLSVDARYTHTDARLDYPGVRVTAYSKNERDEDVASVGVDYKMNDWAQLLVKGYWHDWDSAYTTINNVVQAGTGRITGQTVIDNETYWGYEDKGINALAKLTPHKGFEYVVGYDYQTYSGKDDVLLIEEQTEEVNAVFGQVRTTEDLIQNGAFAAGVRYNDTGGVSTTVWNVSGRYDFTSWLYAQGIIGTSFLLPTAEQLYVIQEPSALGNPDLEPETSENLNLSLGTNWQPTSGSAFQLQATYFDRKIDNLISTALFTAVGRDPTVPFRGRNPANHNNRLFVNVAGEVQVKGYELVSSLSFDNGLSFDGSYTESKSEQKSATGIISDIQRIPKQYAKFGASYRPAGGDWGVNAHLLWTGEQASSVVTNSGTVMYNYGDYTVLDVAAHIYLDDNRKHRITARLQNALDEDYWTRVASALVDGSTTNRFVYGNSGGERTLHLSYSYNF